MAELRGAPVRREPVQRRSRARVEQILAAAGELLQSGGVDALTTRGLADYTGIPVATIYRYFDNRDAILSAYLDHMLAQIEDSITGALMELEQVTFRSVVEAIALAHMRHHRAHPEGVPVWFGGRLNATVVDSVRELDARLAASLRAAMKACGILAETPGFNAELLVRLFDRMFEFVFLVDRAPAEQERIVLAFVDMVAGHMEPYTTPAGREGVPAESFLRALRAGLAADEGTGSGRARNPPSPS